MKNLIFIFLIILTLASCKEAIKDAIDKIDGDPSAEKQILSFNVSSGNYEYSAAVHQDIKTISATFPANVQIDSIAPEILISDKASLTPNSGIVQDFTQALNYVVFAENGTYDVYTVMILGTPSITKFNASNYSVEDTIQIEGKNLYRQDFTTELVFQLSSNPGIKYFFPMNLEDNKKSASMIVTSVLPNGTYYVSVKIDKIESLDWTQVITIQTP